VTRGGYDHDLTYKNICMRGVTNPIAISPYYTNQTTEGFVDPGYKGTKIPDYKKIVLQNIVSETPGDVQIAGIDDAHRTEITLDDVIIRDIKAAQVHVAFADITLVGGGTNVEVSQTQSSSVKVMDERAGPGFNQGFDGKRFAEHTCAGKFVPMQ
jgi:polygalacturonase